MTFKKLMDTLKELEEFGVDMNKPVCVATEEGVRKVKAVFTNGHRDPYMDVRR